MGLIDNYYCQFNEYNNSAATLSEFEDFGVKNETVY